MSRSGYSDEGDNLGLWRHAVERALREEVVRDSEHVCALGSVALARKLDVSNLDIYDGEDMGQAFGISRAMAQEIAYMNDEWVRPGRETNAERWTRMRKWVDENTRAET